MCRAEQKMRLVAVSMRHQQLSHGLAKWVGVSRVLRQLTSSPSSYTSPAVPPSPWQPFAPSPWQQCEQEDGSSPTPTEFAVDVAELERDILHGLERQKTLTSVVMVGAGVGAAGVRTMNGGGEK